ncbi:MAG: alpha/beta hydrolase [Desulfobacterales bacterium]|nr:alpha/beta hydrolase [Desulfobacterales bacterium]
MKSDKNLIKCEREVPFRSDTNPTLKLTLYWYPESTSPTPAVFWFFRGGWCNGNRKNCIQALYLLLHNFALICPDYRMSYQAVFPAQIEDAKAAVRWVRAKADKYNIDPDRFGVWGESAGGYLASMLGVTSSMDIWNHKGHFPDISSAVQAVSLWAAPSNFYHMNDPSGIYDHYAPDSYESRLLGAPIAKVPEKVETANPVNYINDKNSDNVPPFLIMHGSDDKIIIPEQSGLLHEALTAKGFSSEFILLDGYGHEFEFDMQAEIDPVINFFKKHLKKNEV